MPEYRHFIENYARALESMRESSVPDVVMLCSPRIEFHDPFHHTYSSQAYERVLREMFQSVDQLGFKVQRIEGQDRSWMLAWQFTGRNRWIGHMNIAGLSEVECDEKGLIKRHFDYWDAGEHVYQRLPIIGTILRLMVNRRKK